MRTKKPKAQVVVGVDPDVDKNGVAYLDMTNKEMELTLGAMPFPNLIDFLRATNYNCEQAEKKFCVVVEAGWLNRSNWHVHSRDSKAVIAAKGTAAGRNHEVGRKIAEMCRYYAIPYDLMKPLTKIWKGNERKITAQELKTITGYAARTNQEMRDAALLAWVWAGLPIKI